LEWICE